MYHDVHTTMLGSKMERSVAFVGVVGVLQVRRVVL